MHFRAMIIMLRSILGNTAGETPAAVKCIFKKQSKQNYTTKASNKKRFDKETLHQAVYPKRVLSNFVTES